MLVRVKYQPPAHPAIPLTFGLPTYGLIGHDPVSLTAVLDIPDADIPALTMGDFDAEETDTHMGKVLHGGSAQTHAAWHRHLDTRYKEHKGEYRPQLA